MRRTMLAGLFFLNLFSPLAAAEWPTHPITLILPAPAGSNSDLLARILMDALVPALGQPIVLDYRPGASGRLAAQTTATRKPDGYTFFLTTSGPHGAVPAFFKDLNYDPAADFDAVARLVVTPNILYVGKNVAQKNAREFVEFAKKNPGKVTVASGGFGTTQHLSAILFAAEAGIDVRHVPFKGGPEALTAVIGGQVDSAFESAPAIKGQIDAKEVVALANTGPKRSAELAQVPTMAEAGFAAVEVMGWYGIVAPAKTPLDIRTRLAEEIQKALANPVIAEKLRQSLGAEPAYQGLESFSKFYLSEIAKWNDLVRRAGIEKQN